MRPAILCKLKKDTAIDANPGFVDTFNWMVDFINNLTGDKDLDQKCHISIDKTIDDRPVIKSDIDAVGEGEYEIRNVLFNGEPVAKVATKDTPDDIDFIVPSLLGRNGVTVTTEVDSAGLPLIIISGNGEEGEASTEGYSSGTSGDVAIAEIRYIDHRLQVKFVHETWENGVLKSRTVDTNWSDVTIAVPESVCTCAQEQETQEES